MADTFVYTTPYEITSSLIPISNYGDSHDFSGYFPDDDWRGTPRIADVTDFWVAGENSSNSGNSSGTNYKIYNDTVDAWSAKYATDSGAAFATRAVAEYLDLQTWSGHQIIASDPGVRNKRFMISNSLPFSWWDSNSTSWDAYGKRLGFHNYPQKHTEVSKYVSKFRNYNNAYMPWVLDVGTSTSQLTQPQAMEISHGSTGLSPSWKFNLSGFQYTRGIIQTTTYVSSLYGLLYFPNWHPGGDGSIAATITPGTSNNNYDGNGGDPFTVSMSWNGSIGDFGGFRGTYDGKTYTMLFQIFNSYSGWYLYDNTDDIGNSYSQVARFTYGGVGGSYFLDLTKSDLTWSVGTYYDNANFHPDYASNTNRALYTKVEVQSSDSVGIITAGISSSSVASATLENLIDDLMTTYDYELQGTCSKQEILEAAENSKGEVTTKTLESLQQKYVSIAAANNDTSYDEIKPDTTEWFQIQQMNTSTPLTVTDRSEVTQPESDTALIQYMITVPSTYSVADVTTVFENVKEKLTTKIINMILDCDPGVSDLKNSISISNTMKTPYDTWCQPARDLEKSLNCYQSFLNQTTTKTIQHPARILSGNVNNFISALDDISHPCTSMFENILETSGAGTVLTYNASSRKMVIGVRRIIQSSDPNNNDSDQLAGTTQLGQSTSIAQANAISRQAGKLARDTIGWELTKLNL